MDPPLDLDDFSGPEGHVEGRCKWHILQHTNASSLLSTSTLPILREFFSVFGSSHFKLTFARLS